MIYRGWSSCSLFNSVIFPYSTKGFFLIQRRDFSFILLHMEILFLDFLEILFLAFLEILFLGFVWVIGKISIRHCTRYNFPDCHDTCAQDDRLSRHMFTFPPFVSTPIRRLVTTGIIIFALSLFTAESKQSNKTCSHPFAFLLFFKTRKS